MMTEFLLLDELLLEVEILFTMARNKHVFFFFI